MKKCILVLMLICSFGASAQISKTQLCMDVAKEVGAIYEGRAKVSKEPQTFTVENYLIKRALKATRSLKKYEEVVSEAFINCVSAPIWQR